jgi:hypothetical protein
MVRNVCCLSHHPLLGHERPAHRTDMIIPPVPADELVSFPQGVGLAFMLAHHIAERRDKEVMGHRQPPLHGSAVMSLSYRTPWLVIDRQAEIMLDSSIEGSRQAGRHPSDVSPQGLIERDVRGHLNLVEVGDIGTPSARSEYGCAEKRMRDAQSVRRP